MTKTSAEKILGRLKGLRTYIHEGEQPLYSIPVIWENTTDKQSNACDLVLTNQRIFGYIYQSFPRERLFLDELQLESIKVVSVRQKNLEGLFRELFLSDGTKKVYIRAQRKKVEDAYTELHNAITAYSSTSRTLTDEPNASANGRADAPVVFSRQEIHRPMEHSPLAITLLLVSGLLLEIVGAAAWALTGSLQTGLPLFIAGFIAVVVAALTRYQLR